MSSPQPAEISLLQVPKIAGASKPSLLFVDDERSILTALRVVFRGAYDVTVTTDGFEAIELMKTRSFHVIVCDQRMPTITGVEVLRQARELSPDSVRILLTGYSDTDAILGAINDVEVHRFLQKPWDNAKLKQVVDDAIRLARNFVDAAAPADDAPAAVPDDVELDVVERVYAEVLQFPRRSRKPPVDEEEAHSAPAPSAELDIDLDAKETVLVIDPGRSLFDQARAEMAGKVGVEHAASLDDVFRFLASKPVGIIVCSFDVQSEADRTFLQILKREYPFILVIAACDSADTQRLIELINHTKIFRYLRRPVSMKMLSHYVMSAVKLINETRDNRQLLLMQRPDELPESVTRSAASVALQQRFETVKVSLWGRFAAWFKA